MTDSRAMASPDDRRPIRGRAGESPDLADADDSFRSGPGHFPRVYIPAWVALHPDLDEGAIAVAVFVAAYRSTSDDKIPFVGRRLIARRFRRSLDWVDRRTRALCEAGHLHRIRVYRDAVTGERTLSPVSSDGTLNSQVTNDWLFSDTPPEGDRHPHPIMSSEYSHPERITERIRRRERLRSAIEEGGAAPQRPGSEQGKHQKIAGRTPAAPQRPGGPLHSGRGGRSTAALTETKRNGDQANQPRAAASAVDVTPGAGSGSGRLAGEAEEGHDEAAAVLASLPVRTPLPASTVRTLAPHVADLLASGWTPGELTEHWTTGLPASYGVGLVIRRVQDTRPRVRPSTDDLAPQPRRQPVPPWCGECDPEGEAHPALRMVETADGRTRRCPRCHPGVAAEAGSGDQGDAAPSGLLDELDEAWAAGRAG